MDSSLSSSINKSVASKTEIVEEESGWTSYFEDFLSNQRREQSSSSTTSYHNCNNNNSSLVSDAASYVQWKVLSKKNKVSSVPKFSKKLNFPNNKIRAQDIYYDDSLEDTASSPVNSPKVGSLKEIDMNQRKTNDLEKGTGEDNHLQVLQTEEKVEKRVSEGKNDNINEYNALKKRELCLVPKLPILLNYLG